VASSAWAAIEYTIRGTNLTTIRPGGYVTEVTPEQLKGAPKCARNTDENWFDRENERTLNDYYGSEYYWSE
jgi:hypothetical protein